MPDATATAQPLTLVDLDTDDGQTLDALSLRSDLTGMAGEAEALHVTASLVRDAFALYRIEDVATSRVADAERDGFDGFQAQAEATLDVLTLRDAYRHAPAYLALDSLASRLEDLRDALEDSASLLPE